MRIAFCMNNFSELGIQRVLIWLANSWPLDSGDQLILVVHNSSGPLREQLAPHVKLVELDGLVYNANTFSSSGLPTLPAAVEARCRFWSKSIRVYAALGVPQTIGWF
jgi:hypothetical protein